MVSADDSSSKINEGSEEHRKQLAENERIFAEKTELARREMGAEIIRERDETGMDVELLRPAEGRRYTDEDLREIQEFDAFLEHLGSTAIEAQDYIGTGASVLIGDERQKLVGEPFAILQFNFTHSQYGGYYVYVEVIDKHNHRYAFMSGAQFSIRDELAMIAMRTEQFHGVICRGGLKMRTYPYPKEPVEGVKQIDVKVYSIAPVPKENR